MYKQHMVRRHGFLTGSLVGCQSIYNACHQGTGPGRLRYLGIESSGPFFCPTGEHKFEHVYFHLFQVSAPRRTWVCCVCVFWSHFAFRTESGNADMPQGLDLSQGFRRECSLTTKVVYTKRRLASKAASEEFKLKRYRKKLSLDVPGGSKNLPKARWAQFSDLARPWQRAF